MGRSRAPRARGAASPSLWSARQVAPPSLLLKMPSLPLPQAYVPAYKVLEFCGSTASVVISVDFGIGGVRSLFQLSPPSLVPKMRPSSVTT